MYLNLNTYIILIIVPFRYRLLYLPTTNKKKYIIEKILKNYEHLVYLVCNFVYKD